MRRAILTAALATLSLSLLGAAEPPRVRSVADDATILARFEDMVSADISCAKLAVEQGHSQDVRNLATMLMREHEMARLLARDANTQGNFGIKWKDDGPYRAEHDKVLKELRGRPDVAFDVLFVRHEVAYHKQLVETIAKEWAPSAKSPDLQSLFSQVAPAFEEHLKAAEQIAQRLLPRG